jgi:TolA-binding protein
MNSGKKTEIIRGAKKMKTHADKMQMDMTEQNTKMEKLKTEMKELESRAASETQAMQQRLNEMEQQLGEMKRQLHDGVEKVKELKDDLKARDDQVQRGIALYRQHLLSFQDEPNDPDDDFAEGGCFVGAMQEVLKEAGWEVDLRGGVVPADDAASSTTASH